MGVGAEGLLQLIPEEHYCVREGSIRTLLHLGDGLSSGWTSMSTAMAKAAGLLP